MTFARCSVTLGLVAPIDDAIAIHLYRGSLLSGEGQPWFCLVEEIKLGIGTTVTTDAECCDPGKEGNIQAGTLHSIAGYPSESLTVTNGPATGGSGGEVVSLFPGSGSKLARKTVDERLAKSDRDDVATLIRMNIGRLDHLPEKLQNLCYGATSRFMYNPEAVLLADVYGTVARVVLGIGGEPKVAMGFVNTKLVYLSTGREPSINTLPGGARLFLPSEGVSLKAD